MIAELRRTEWRRITMPLAGLVAVAGITLVGLAGAKNTGGGGELGAVQAAAPRSSERSLPERLAAVDRAIARRDPSRAMYEWREAYSIALGSRRWEAMTAVGDAARRIDVLAAPGPSYATGFRAEARQAYLTAFLDARAAGSREGMERVAEAFASLGDADVSAKMRAMAGAR